MANLVFNAQFIPTSSTQVTVTDFDVSANVVDLTGFFAASDVQVGDAVFLDTFNSITSPGTVSKYTVINVFSNLGASVSLRLRYEDTGAVVDPSEVIGNPGFIARVSSSAELAWHPAPTIQSVPDYLIQYSRDNENFNIIDQALTQGTKLVGQTTTGMTAGQIGHSSSSNVWLPARADDGLGDAISIAVYAGTPGEMSLPGSLIDNVLCTTQDGQPSIGSIVFLAPATYDLSTALGKVTALSPTPPPGDSHYLVQVGVCVDNSNYVSDKKIKIIFQPSYPVLLRG